ncbi:pre-toxin TG domain-containing protein [Caldifermentibacillus hisashii]|uniref:pre-toxin TG domain-containing protein n=1 Tax=Caldifermentibacillus hisashii TaxID=996558 RepID=UPI0031FE3891
MGNKVSEFLLELIGWNDAQRVFSEYDPVTGEKLSFDDRVLAGGFLALSLLPPAKSTGNKIKINIGKTDIDVLRKNGMFQKLTQLQLVRLM